mmetsp:Transcript_8626/g.27032  ORF Transcript_8626/g.27032 Transcript_8626/m.27032 type:complete len:211 (+) Transcript_8626:612-1244(+)
MIRGVERTLPFVPHRFSRRERSDDAAEPVVPAAPLLLLDLPRRQAFLGRELVAGAFGVEAEEAIELLAARLAARDLRPELLGLPRRVVGGFLDLAAERLGRPLEVFPELVEGFLDIVHAAAVGRALPLLRLVSPRLLVLSALGEEGREVVRRTRNVAARRSRDGRRRAPRLLGPRGRREVPEVVRRRRLGRLHAPGRKVEAREGSGHLAR